MTQRAEQLETEADVIRAQLAESIEELRSSVSPSNIMHRLKERGQASIVGFARGAGQTLREHPAPVALGALAAAGLLARSLFSRSEREAGRALSSRRRPLAWERARWRRNSRPNWASDRRAAESGGVLSFVREKPFLAAILGVGASAAVAALLPAGEEWSTDKPTGDSAQRPEGMAGSKRENPLQTETALATPRAASVMKQAERKPCAATPAGNGGVM